MNPSYVVALLIGLAACATDLRSRRIPNILTFTSAAAGLIFHVASSGVDGLIHAGGGWLVGVAVFFLPFALGGMGGGDIKLLAALGAWLGPALTLWLALYTGVAGGVMAIVVAVARGYLGQAVSNLWTLLAHWRAFGLRPVHEITLEGSRAPKLAYAVPIFLGTVLTLWLR